MAHPLESKFWYRILKVLFFLALAFSFVVVLVIAYGIKPYKSFSNERSYIHCTGGINKDENFLLQKNRFYLFSTYMSSTDQVDARKLCDYDRINITSDLLYPDKGIPNYTLVPLYDTIGSWDNAFYVVLIGSCVVLVVFWLIRATFFYIATGKFDTYPIHRRKRND